MEGQVPIALGIDLAKVLCQLPQRLLLRNGSSLNVGHVPPCVFPRHFQGAIEQIPQIIGQIGIENIDKAGLTKIPIAAKTPPLS